MKNFLQKKLILIVCSILLLLNISPITAMANPKDLLDIKGEAAILVDAASGRILYQKNPDEKLHPASMTKMLTEYILLENVNNGKIKWDQNVPISDYAYKISQNRKLSNVPLRKDGQYTVRELYESMAIYSANGSAIALAELIAGSESNFVKMMNEKAAQIGIKDFNFVNCTGLNNEDLMGMQPAGGPNDENVMSARGVATLAFRLLNDYPEVLNTSSIPRKVFKEGTKMDNWNWMLPGLVYAYNGVDGLKTGSTDLGGYSFTATAKRDNMRLISVVMKTSSYEERFAETKKLLDYGFNNYSIKEIYPAGYKIASQTEVPVVNGKQKKVGVETQKPLLFAVKKGEENSFEPIYQIDKSLISDKGILKAPIKKGQVIGSLIVNYKGSDNYGYLLPDYIEKSPLIATSEVKKASWITLAFRSLIEFIANLLKH